MCHLSSNLQSAEQVQLRRERGRELSRSYLESKKQVVVVLLPSPTSCSGLHLQDLLLPLRIQQFWDVSPSNPVRESQAVSHQAQLGSKDPTPYRYRRGGASVCYSSPLVVVLSATTRWNAPLHSPAPHQP